MASNVTPEYLQAQEKYDSASTDEEKLIALNEMKSTVPKHKGAEGMRSEINKKLSTWTQPGTLYDSGWIEFSSMKGEESTMNLDHGLLDFGDNNTSPIPRAPDLCKVYVRVPEGNGHNLEGMIFEAGGINTVDNDSGDIGALVYLFNEKEISFFKSVLKRNEQKKNKKTGKTK